MTSPSGSLCDICLTFQLAVHLGECVERPAGGGVRDRPPACVQSVVRETTRGGLRSRQVDQRGGRRQGVRAGEDTDSLLYSYLQVMYYIKLCK